MKIEKKQTSKKYKLNKYDAELAMERALATQWVRDHLLLLALNKRLTPDTLQQSFDQFQQQNPEAKIDMHSMWIPVLKLPIGLQVLAFPLAESSLALQKRKNKIRGIQ